MAEQHHILAATALRAAFLRRLGTELKEQRRALAISGREILEERRNARRRARQISLEIACYLDASTM